MNQNCAAIDRAKEGFDISLDFFSAFPEATSQEEVVFFKYFRKELSLARGLADEDPELSHTLERASALLKTAAGDVQNFGFPLIAAEIEGMAAEIMVTVTDSKVHHGND